MDINGKTAIVTGSAGGIGRATAVMLAARGAAEIRLVDVKEDALAETARLVAAKGARVTTHILDLSDVPAVEAWFQAHGDVDILHNTAGVVSGLPQFPDVDAARIRWITDWSPERAGGSAAWACRPGTAARPAATTARLTPVLMSFTTSSE